MGHKCRRWGVALLFVSACLLSVPGAATADPIPIDADLLVSDADVCCARVWEEGPGFGQGVAHGWFDVKEAVSALHGNGKGRGHGRIDNDNPGGENSGGIDVGSASIDDPSDDPGLALVGGSLFDSSTPVLVGSSASGNPGGQQAAAFGLLFLPTTTNHGFAFEEPPTPNPEPATLLLLGSGLAGIAMRARRRKNKNL